MVEVKRYIRENMMCFEDFITVTCVCVCVCVCLLSPCDRSNPLL